MIMSVLPRMNLWGDKMKKFIDDIKACLKLCNEILEDFEKGIVHECTKEQVTDIIIPEMNKLLEFAESGRFPPQDKRYLISFAYAFKDWGWDMSNPTELYLCLVNLDREYRGLKQPKWIFFDIGSTLVDETEAYNHRIRDAIAGTEITAEQLNEKLIYFAKQNLKGDLEAIKFFGLTKTPWHKEDEFLYPDAEKVLQYLWGKGYKIGVIANQSLGTAERLEKWGLSRYIDVVAASAELGVAKPDERIFRHALEQAECAAENAVMVGDRLDNDIYPAKKLGMKTVWVKQGFAVYQTPDSEEYEADWIVDSLGELLEIF